MKTKRGFDVRIADTSGCKMPKAFCPSVFVGLTKAGESYHYIGWRGVRGGRVGARRRALRHGLARGGSTFLSEFSYFLRVHVIHEWRVNGVKPAK